LSAPLARALERVFSWDPKSRFASAEAFAEELAALPPALAANEATVAEELRHLVADLLDDRLRKLALLRGSAGLPDPDDATRVYGPVPGGDDEDAEEAATRAFERAPYEEALRDVKLARAVEESHEPQSPPPPSKTISARARAFVVPRFDAHARIVERMLLGVLVVLLVIASALVLAQPSRLRVLVYHVKALR